VVTPELALAWNDRRKDALPSWKRHIAELCPAGPERPWCPVESNEAMAFEGRLNPAYSRILRGDVGSALRKELASTEPAPPRLMNLLAQLEARVQAHVERERLFAAVERAVDALKRLDCLAREIGKNCVTAR
jgi:hypothetical protein